MFEVRLQQNSVYRQYERTLYNIIDVLTDLGGMFSSLTLIGLAFNLTFSYNLLLSSLIRKLYHFKPRFDSEIKKKKQKDKNAPKTYADDDADKGGNARPGLKRKDEDDQTASCDQQSDDVEEENEYTRAMGPYK